MSETLIVHGGRHGKRGEQVVQENLECVRTIEKRGGNPAESRLRAGSAESEGARGSGVCEVE